MNLTETRQIHKEHPSLKGFWLKGWQKPFFKSKIQQAIMNDKQWQQLILHGSFKFLFATPEISFWIEVWTLILK